MDPKFQTSFIPKKNMPGTTGMNVGLMHPQKFRRVTSIFMTLAIVLFVASILGAGGAYAWKQYLTGAQAGYKKDLADREKQFNIDLIEQLKQENVKIDTARQLLSKHLAISRIFAFISSLTIENVRFLSMEISTPTTQSDELKINLTGHGTDLASVAFQSDVFGQLEKYGLRKIVKNPTLSNPSLDPKGTVSFGFTATIDPSSVLYEKNFSSQSTPANTK